MKRQNYRYIIAIDPDARESGVVFLDVRSRTFSAHKMMFADLMKFLYLQTLNSIEEKKETTKVVIEAGWLNESNWHITGKYMSARKAAAIGRSVGMNHQTGMLIEQMSKDYFKLPTELQKPLKKCWKGKDGKITQEEMAEVTGKEKLPRMNQDQRDALLIAWVHSGLPMKTVTTKKTNARKTTPKDTRKTTRMTLEDFRKTFK